MKHLLTCGAISVFFLLIVTSCSDDPSELGKGLTSPNDGLKIDSAVVFANRDTSFLYEVVGTGNSLVGYSQGVEVRTLMQFTGFTAIPSTVTVDSAIVTFPVDFKFLDSTGTIGFEVHEMLNAWSQSTFKWDSVSVAGEYNATPSSTFLGNVVPSDSTIQFHIDQLVAKWIQAGTDAPDGMMLIPSSISSSLIIGSLSNALIETRPHVVVYYRNGADTDRTSTFYTTQRTFAANSPQPVMAGRLFAQAGIAFRTRVQFDSLILPPKASINRAILTVSFDGLNSEVNHYTRDSLLISQERKNVYPFDSLAYTTICAPTTIGAQKIYQANVTQLVQAWISREPNYGILLRTFDENSDVERFALYGSLSPQALKPKLVVTFTTFK